MSRPWLGGFGREAWGVALVLAVQAAALVHAGWGDSVVVDEAGHIASGLVHWTEGDFHPYNVNPPLVRLLGTAPLLVLGPRVPIAEPGSGAAYRPEMLLGRRFAEWNSDRYVGFVRLARWAPIGFSLLASWLVWSLARRYGSAAGWISLLLWASRPLVLGHGHLLTADMGATCLGLWVVWWWDRLGREPTRGNAARLGSACGLALLAKFTSLFVVGVVGLMEAWGIVVGRGGSRTRAAGRLATTVAVAWLALQTGYAWDAPIFRGRDVAPELRPTWLNRPPLDLLPVPLPREFVLGIERQRRDFAQGMRSYLDGVIRERGWWSYYLRAMLYKTPVGHLVLLGAAIVAAVAVRFRGVARREWALGVGLIALISSQTGFSHHLRYLLPALPFLDIAAGSTLALVAARTRLAAPLIGVALAASGLSVAWNHPHHIGFFNELVGGWRRGHEHLLDSNLNWGQDLLRVRDWLDAHPDENRQNVFLVAYHEVDPASFGINFRYPRAAEFGPPEPGTYILSINALMGYDFLTSDGQGNLIHYPRGAFAAFRDRKPDGWIGRSFRVFHVRPAEGRDLGMGVNFGAEDRDPDP